MADFYDWENYPSQNSLASSSQMRAELQKIETAFQRLANYTSNSGKLVGINDGGTGYVTRDAEQVRTFLDLTNKVRDIAGALLATLSQFSYNTNTNALTFTPDDTTNQATDAAGALLATLSQFAYNSQTRTLTFTPAATATRSSLQLDNYYEKVLPRLTSSNTKVIRNGQSGVFDYTLVNDDVGKFLQFWVMPPDDTTGNHRNDITIPTLSSMTIGKRIFLLLKATVVDEEQSCTIRAIPSTSSPPTIKAAVHGNVSLTTTSGQFVTLLRATFVEDMPAGGAPDPVGGFEASKAVTLICTANNEYTLYEGLHA